MPRAATLVATSTSVLFARNEFERPVPRVLREVALELARGVPHPEQVTNELLGTVLGAMEDDRLVQLGGALAAQQARQRIDLLRLHDVHDAVFERRHLLVDDADPRRCMQVLGDHPLHPVGHRRGGEHRLTARAALECGAHADDLLDVVREALIEHLVGLVQHEVLDVAQARDAGAREVEQASGTPDDHVGRVAQAAGLRPVPDATDADDRAQRGIDLADDRVHLRGELAGRCHDQRAGTVALVPGEALDERDHERERLSRSGRRLDDAVLAAEQWRNRLLLDRVRFRETVLTENGGRARAHADGFKRCHRVYLGNRMLSDVPESPRSSVMCRILETRR